MGKFILPTIVAVAVTILAHSILFESFHGAQKPQNPKA